MRKVILAGLSSAGIAFTAAACSAPNGSKGVAVSTGGRSIVQEAMSQCNAAVVARADVNRRNAGAAEGTSIDGVEVLRDGADASRACSARRASTGDAIEYAVIPIVSRFFVLPDRQVLAAAEIPAEGGAPAPPTNVAAGPIPSEDGSSSALTAAQVARPQTPPQGPVPPQMRGQPSQMRPQNRARRGRLARVRVAIAPRLSISPAPANAEEAQMVVERIGAICVPRVRAVFLRAQIDVELAIRPAVAGDDGPESYPRLNLTRIPGADEAAPASYEHVIWPGGSRFLARGRVAGGAPPEDIRARAQQLERDNDPFCQDLVKLVGLWLGMTDPRAEACAAALPAQVNPRNAMLGSSFSAPTQDPSTTYWARAEFSVGDRLRPIDSICPGVRSATEQSTRRPR